MAVEGINQATLLPFLISFKTVWFGALLGASFPGAPLLFGVLFDGTAASCAVYLWSGAT